LISKEEASLEHSFHTVTLMNIATDTQSNIFLFFAEEELHNMWWLIMELESAIDLKNHFHALDDVRKAASSNAKWFEDSQNKVLVMKLLVMAINISDIARPFDYASIFKAHVINCLYDGLDLLRCYGMTYIGEERTREKLDREASTVALVRYKIAEVFPLLSPAGRHEGTDSSNILVPGENRPLPIPFSTLSPQNYI
jgi:hypothetical protein